MHLGDRSKLQKYVFSQVISSYLLGLLILQFILNSLRSLSIKYKRKANTAMSVRSNLLNRFNLILNGQYVQKYDSVLFETTKTGSYNLQVRSSHTHKKHRTAF